MGCQMNAHDSDFLAQSLIDGGFVPVNDPEQADVILVNTCVVRAKPEQKAYSFLGRASAIKAANPAFRNSSRPSMIPLKRSWRPVWMARLPAIEKAT